MPEPSATPASDPIDHAVRESAPSTGSASSAFAQLADYVALPRLNGLTLSPDGQRLVTTVSTPAADQQSYVSALWEIDPAGLADPRRLTRSTAGEANPAFQPDGGLLFTSSRPRPDHLDDDDDHAALWLLPAPGGEAVLVLDRPGGISAVRVARSGAVVLGTDVLPGSADAATDRARRKARADAGVTALLHDRYPVRYWDHDLGPGDTHVLTTGVITTDGPIRTDGVDLTPDGIRSARPDLDVARDGSAVAYVRVVPDGPARIRSTIVVADRGDGRVRLTVGEPGAEFTEPVFGPDADWLVCVRTVQGTWEEPHRDTLWLVDLRTGQGRDPAPAFPLGPRAPVAGPDGRTVFFVADEQGHAPIFRLDLESGRITRLTAAGAYSDVVGSDDGTALYALRSGYDRPPTPVRVDPLGADQDPVLLRSPGDVGRLPGHFTEVRTTAEDGTALRAWLVLPEGATAASPAPLLLWIHGGPVSSWNSWSWRWNPWIMAAHGYAVLLPDPGLSTGYGPDFVRRGWGDWGGHPFTDLMAITDAVSERHDVDADRTAAMGGSFGGYMANWIASHTDRFRAIVSHASLWHLEAFAGVTDLAGYWQEEFGDPLRQRERYAANSPHHFVAQVRTPMLVIHGDKDYRVPVGEALHLWYDLLRHSVPARFLYFPSEGHWVLTPGNAAVWYETVLAFLAEHVLGEAWVRPDLL